MQYILVVYSHARYTSGRMEAAAVYGLQKVVGREPATWLRLNGESLVNVSRYDWFLIDFVKGAPFLNLL